MMHEETWPQLPQSVWMRRENKQNEETSKLQSLGKIDILKKNGILEEGLSLSNIFENLVRKEEKMIINRPHEISKWILSHRINWEVQIEWILDKNEKSVM